MKKYDTTGYKAFAHGMKCRDKQYTENTVFEEAGANDCCEAGVMHYCENPLDTLRYYPLIDDECRLVEIAEVKPLAEVLRKEDKCATKKLKIGAKLSLKDFIKASIKVMFEKAKEKDDGYYAQLASSGNYAKLASSGYSAKLASSGYSAQLASSGYSAKLASSGYYAKLASSGDYAKLASSGDYAQLASSGYSAKLASSGYYSVVAGIGGNNIAKAALGNWIVLAEWGWENDDNYTLKCVKAVQVDGEKIKADTWYKLVNGEFVEA